MTWRVFTESNVRWKWPVCLDPCETDRPFFVPAFVLPGLRKRIYVASLGKPRKSPLGAQNLCPCGVCLFADAQLGGCAGAVEDCGSRKSDAAGGA